jgi:trehalose-phosphatase
VFFFLDFGWNLTPIIENPADARLSPEAHKILTALSARDDVLMALMSGRALSDIRDRAAIAGLVYAGNHGLEISPPDSPCLFASGSTASSAFFGELRPGAVMFKKEARSVMRL